MHHVYPVEFENYSTGALSAMLFAHGTGVRDNKIEVMQTSESNPSNRVSPVL